MKKQKKRFRFPFLGKNLVCILMILLLILPGCPAPNSVDLSKPETVADLISKMNNLTDQQKKDLTALVQKGQGVSASTVVDSTLMQKIADLKKQSGEIDKKIADTQSNINSQIANNNNAIVTDFTNKLSATNASFNTQLTELYRQKNLLESKLNDQVSKLAELDRLTRDFITQNKKDIDLLYSGMNQLKVNGLLQDEHVKVVKDLQVRIDSMNELFAKIFASVKTAGEEQEENRQILEKLMVNNFARSVTVDITQPTHPSPIGSGSINLLFKTGDILVFSTAAHVSKDVYLSQRGIGRQRFGTHISPVQMLGLKTVAPKPISFNYNDNTSDIRIIVSDKYSQLMDQEAAFLLDNAKYEARMLEIYTLVYNLAITLSFHNSLALSPPSSIVDPYEARWIMEDLESALSGYTLNATDQAIVNQMNPFFAELDDIITNHIIPNYYALSALSQQELAEDVSFVLVRDTENQLKDLKPLMTLTNGQFTPQTVIINGRPVIVSFTIDNIIGNGVNPTGVGTRIMAGGIPFDSLDEDQQDVDIDYNGSVLDWKLEADIWFEEKQISRVHQPKPMGQISGSRQGIPNYFQVTGSMGSGNSGGLNWTIESYKSKALTSGGVPLLTKEGKVVLLGYDNTLRTTDTLPVYLSAEGLLTEVQTGSFLRVGTDGKIGNGTKTITNDLQWSEIKTMQGLGVNSFSVLDWWSGTVISSNVASFAPNARSMRTKLEDALNITLPSSVYKKDLVVTLAQ